MPRKRGGGARKDPEKAKALPEGCKMNRPRGRPRGRGRGRAAAMLNANMVRPIQQMEQMIEMQPQMQPDMQPQQQLPPQPEMPPTPINILPLNCQEDVKPIVSQHKVVSTSEADPIDLDSPSPPPSPPSSAPPVSSSTSKADGTDPWWDTFLDGRPNQGPPVPTATNPAGLQAPPLPSTEPSPTMPMLNKEGYIQIEPTVDHDDVGSKPPSLQKQQLPEVTSSSVYIDVAEDPRHSMKRRLADPNKKMGALLQSLSDYEGEDDMDESYSPQATSDASDEYEPTRSKRPRKRRASKGKARKASAQSSTSSVPEKTAVEPHVAPESQVTAPDEESQSAASEASINTTEKLEKIRMIQKEIERCHEILQQEVAEYESQQGDKLVVPGLPPIIKKEPIFVNLLDDDTETEGSGEGSANPLDMGCQVEIYLLHDLIPEKMGSLPELPEADAPALDGEGEDGADEELPNLTHVKSHASQTDYSPKIASLKQLDEYQASLIPKPIPPRLQMRPPMLPQSPTMPQSPRMMHMQHSPRQITPVPRSPHHLPQSPRQMPQTMRQMPQSPLQNMPQSPRQMSPRMVSPRMPRFSPRASPRGTPRKNFNTPRPRMSRPLFPNSEEVISLLDEDNHQPSAAPMPLIQQALRGKKPAAKSKSGLSVQAMHLIPLSANHNKSLSVEQRPFYMGFVQGVHKWVNVLVKVINGQTKYQCALCPRDFPQPMNVHEHMQMEHRNYMYLIMGKREMKDQVTQFLYCRHCNFVTCSKPAIWYHFVLWHSITVLSQDIKVRSDSTSAQLVTTNGDLQKAPVAYMCLSCKGVELNRTRIVSHAMRKHPNSPNIMGGFVKLKELNLNKVTIRGQPKQLAVGDDTLLDKSISSFCYVCVECSIVQYMEQEQLSHMMDMHSDKTMLYICCKCEMRFDFLFDIVSHARTTHQASNVQHCTVTLIELTPGSRKHRECNPYPNTNPASTKRLTKSPKVKRRAPPPQPFASDEIVALEDSDDELQVVSIEHAPKSGKKGMSKQLSARNKALGLSYTPQKTSMRFNTNFSAQVHDVRGAIEVNGSAPKPSAAQSVPTTDANSEPTPGTSTEGSSTEAVSPATTAQNDTAQNDSAQNDSAQNDTTEAPLSQPTSPASDASLIHRAAPEKTPSVSSSPSSPHLLSLGDELPAYPEFAQPPSTTTAGSSLNYIMAPHDSLAPLVSSDKDPMMPSTLTTPPIRPDDPAALTDIVDDSCATSLAIGQMMSANSERKEATPPPTNDLDTLLVNDTISHKEKIYQTVQTINNADNEAPATFKELLNSEESTTAANGDA